MGRDTGLSLDSLSTSRFLRELLNPPARMSNRMLGMLGALLCVLAVSAEVLPPEDFDLQQCAGKWHLIGFATNAHWFVSKKADMKQGIMVLTPTAEGDMDMSYSSRKTDGTCWEMNHLAQKTETPGRFTYYSKRWGNSNDLRVVEVKYDEYILTHTIKTKAGRTDILNKLYGRTLDLRPELLQRFEQFCLDTGIEKDNIVILPQNEECSPKAA